VSELVAVYTRATLAETRREHAYADLTLVCLPGLIWGASFLFIAQGLVALAPDGVTFLRFLFGFAALSCVPEARRPIAAEDRGGVGWLGLLWLAFPMSMFPHAEQSVSSALTGMLNGSVPLVATAVAALRERRTPSSIVTAAIAVGFGGCALMAAPELGHGSSSKAGIAMIGAALISYGVGSTSRALFSRGTAPCPWCGERLVWR
jgi:drug/metabolite transporter (DMT)-like permease